MNQKEAEGIMDLAADYIVGKLIEWINTDASEIPVLDPKYNEVRQWISNAKKLQSNSSNQSEADDVSKYIETLKKIRNYSTSTVVHKWIDEVLPK